MYVLKEIIETPSWNNTDHVDVEVNNIICCGDDQLAELYQFVSYHYQISYMDLEMLKEYLYVSDVNRASDDKRVSLDIEEVMEL